MNEIEVERQIEQMVRFIKQEAEEKANEIRVSAEEEFNLEKLQLLEQEKARIRKEYERRESQVEVKKKIEYSKTLNEARLKVLAAREAAIQTVVKEARGKVREAAKNPSAYKKMMQDLLVQAMHKLREPTALVRVRQSDLMLAKEVLEPARKQYSASYGKESPTLTLDQRDFLPPPPSGKGDEGDEAVSCSGGVVVTSADGRIVVSNTLDHRVHIAYEANLPDIRGKLFGVVASGAH
ncbi:vacuolar ATP synthase subunit E [Scenedesmus sp. NREL 46B-D3]|nr:vacuolar ATP synthase subunit E [Scenedesmus sp. NREL 46B-D3]